MYCDSVCADSVVSDANPKYIPKNGYHIETYSDGSKYEGNFKNDKYHGFGVYIWANVKNGYATKYEGNWKNGIQHGQGTMYYKENRNGYFVKYTGNWVNGQREGQGTCYYKDGSSQSGTWKNGNLISSTQIKVDYPITIQINKSEETDIQRWNISRIILYKDKTIIYGSVYGKVKETTAYIDGSESIIDNNGRVYKIQSSTLPKGINPNFIISEKQTFYYEEVFPPISRDAKSIKYSGGLNNFGYINIPW